MYLAQPENGHALFHGIYSAYEEIEQFMDSLKNKSIYEQKMKLGARLFPKIRELDFTSAVASKITLNLLDTDDLRGLAHSMHDPDKFRQRILVAIDKVRV
ncbi:33821_t:CDS:2 [Gigaspora margarita]|uniref:33821_t:CDS:1 n=1 Tax=Gigaspora margarita TaxID=4874 RepID=A0ABN7V1V9_GIGMA|nr:33821_t:CDS:2 [Gigaspora margarita]